MLKINIPTPCHQDWNAMIPNIHGRHCNSCVKTVVDFTAMTDDEVKHFFLNKQHQSVCGRFKTTQLKTIEIQLPQNIFSDAIPLWKKFLAACLLAFSMILFSCNTNLQGKVEKDSNIEITGALVIRAADSTKQQIDTIALPKPPKCNEDVKGEVQVIEQIYTTGNLAPISVEPQKQETFVGKLEFVELPKVDSAKMDTTRCDKKIFL